MKKLFFIAFTVLTVLCTACKNTDLIGPSVTSVASSSNSYQPITTGSVWKYTYKVAGKPDEQIMVRATGLTSLIDSKMYYALSTASSINGTSTNYYTDNGYQYSFRSENIVANNIVEIQYLNTPIPVGEQWITNVNNNGTIDGIPARIQGSIIESNISKTVSGQIFSSVIHTAINLQYDRGEGFKTVATYNYYLAKNIGLIEVDYCVSGVMVSQQTIVSYNVK